MKRTTLHEILGITDAIQHLNTAEVSLKTNCIVLVCHADTYYVGIYRPQTTLPSHIAITCIGPDGTYVTKYIPMAGSKITLLPDVQGMNMSQLLVAHTIATYPYGLGSVVTPELVQKVKLPPKMGKPLSEHVVDARTEIPSSMDTGVRNTRRWLEDLSNALRDNT